MLVLTRYQEERIRIGDDIIIQVQYVDTEHRKVKLGIIAPKGIPVHREEVYVRRQRDAQRKAALDKVQKGNHA